MTATPAEPAVSRPTVAAVFVRGTRLSGMGGREDSSFGDFRWKWRDSRARAPPPPPPPPPAWPMQAKKNRSRLVPDVILAPHHIFLMAGSVRAAVPFPIVFVQVSLTRSAKALREKHYEAGTETSPGFSAL